MKPAAAGERPLALAPMRARDMRRQNRQLVLGELRRESRLSRRELAAATSLTSQSLADILGGLVDEGLARELRVHESGSGRGRPPIFYEMNPRCGTAFGVFIGRRKTVVAFADARGRELERRTSSTVLGDPETVIAQISETILELRSGHDLGSVPAVVAVAVHGEVDSATGRCLEARALGWRDVDLAGELSRRVELPVTALVAAHAVVLAEHREGFAQGLSDVVVLHLGLAPAAGILLNGELFRGHSGRAGAIRACTVPDSRADPGNGSPFDAVASGAALVERYLQSNPATVGASWAADITAAATAGDGEAQEVLGQAADAVVVAAQWLIGCFGPQSLILSGGLVDVPAANIVPLVHRIYQAVPPSTRSEIEIAVSPLGANGPIRGAVIRAVDHLERLLDAP